MNSTTYNSNSYPAHEFYISTEGLEDEWAQVQNSSRNWQVSDVKLSDVSHTYYYPYN